MNNWKTLLENVDDDYLTGMANKGIVKRAYKDKEEGNYQVLSMEEEAKVCVGGETVTVCVPLGESKCSCPSRSICRHVILGIMALKEQTAKEGRQQPLKEAAAYTEKPQETEQAEVEKSDLKEKLMEEIAACSFGTLKKILGGKQLLAIAGQIKAGYKPKIEYASIITVELQEMGQKVKLLSPLEYSTCTCHKKELCVHKAAALVWCKLEAGLLSARELEEEVLTKPSFDGRQVREAAVQMQLYLEELLNTGLARTSPDGLDYMERLAIISHNARLARFEGYWRALRDSYESYFKRKASFRVQTLMVQLARLYQRTVLLQKAENDSQIYELAGEFKAEYLPAGDLDLTGIAMEHFESQAGYEGETIYFLEENTRQWYTFTWAKPVFYEKSGRRGRGEKAKAPWGLPFSLEDMAISRIHLTNAKADRRRRLSSSQETKGELTERKKDRRLQRGDLGGWYYRDFDKLFEEQIDKKRRPWLKEQEEDGEEVSLVFIRPDSCEEAVFSETEQKLFMRLFDKAGREIVVEVAYSKRESWGIRYLERITGKKLPCFLGKIYFKDGRIRMYPVAVFEKGELWEDGEFE